jgi:hypothetical protein
MIEPAMVATIVRAQYVPNSMGAFPNLADGRKLSPAGGRYVDRHEAGPADRAP